MEKKIKKKKIIFIDCLLTAIVHTSKIKKVTLYLKKEGADYLFITASENNAWLLNIRGHDTEYAPIPHSYILIDKYQKVYFFCDLKKIGKSLKNNFKRVNFLDIKLANKILSEIYNKKFIIDNNSCSYYFENIITKNNRLLKSQDPIYLFKSIKSRKEIENIKTAHIYDGSALTKYLFWVKKNFKNKNITEISAAK